MTIGSHDDHIEDCHILLVEDNPGDVGLIRRALAHRQPRTHLHVACDAVQALDFLHQCGQAGAAPYPDLMLVDLNLPRMDGCELLRHIKQETTLTSIPVIVLSSSHAEADVVRSYEHHANCFVTKPLELEQYLAVIGAVHHFWLAVVKSSRSRKHV